MWYIIFIISKYLNFKYLAKTLLLNLSNKFFGLLELYKAMTFIEKIMIMDYNNGLYSLEKKSSSQKDKINV